MKAAVYHGNRDVRVEDIEEPVPAEGEVKLRIDYCGICATDIEEYEFGPQFISHEAAHPLTGKMIPMTVGHETTGTVVETGEGVVGVRTGDRVVINGMVSCGKCRWCQEGQTTQCQSWTAVGFGRDGGLAEYMTWPASQAILLPDKVSSQAAALAEPASVAHHAVLRSRLAAGERVAVLGVGTVGMLAMQVAKSMGALVYAVDRRKMSLDLALELGADAAVNVGDADGRQALKELTDGVGPDVIIDAAGGPDTPAQAVKWVRRGGRVVLVAIYTAKPQFDFNSVVVSEAELVGSMGYLKGDVEAVVALIASGAIKTTPLISDIIGLAEVLDVGYARMRAATKDIFRILVAPGGGKGGRPNG